jgi:tryptophanyl-tRNA synthetase
MTPGGITPITGMLNSIGESSMPIGANASNMSVGNNGTGVNTADNKKGISPQNTLNNMNGVPMDTLNPMMMQQVPMSGTASVPVTGLAPLTNEQIQQSSLTVSQVGLNKDSVGSSVVGSSNNTPGLMMKPVGRAADIIAKKGFNTDVNVGKTDNHEGVVGAIDDTSDLQKKRTASESSPNDSKRVKKPTKAKKTSVKKRGGKKGEVPAESSPVSNSKNEADEELDQSSVEHDHEKNDVEGTEPAAKPRRRRALTEAERRANFLERNRVAASRCRQRKKEMVETMKIELASTQAENEALQEQVETLREHALTLRTLLYAHRDCPSLLGQVGGPDSLSAVLAATNYAAELTAEGEGAREQGDELPNVAAVVAHTTSMAIERERRTSK